MIALIIALGVLLVTVTILALVNKKEQEEEPGSVPDIDCCGAHEVCEKDLETFLTTDTLYYEDEELDRFSNQNAQYNPEDIEEFRDILYTLKHNEISQWLSSLEFRKINTPEVIRDEAMLLLED